MNALYVCKRSQCRILKKVQCMHLHELLPGQPYFHDIPTKVIK